MFEGLAGKIIAAAVVRIIEKLLDRYASDPAFAKDADAMLVKWRTAATPEERIHAAKDLRALQSRLFK